MVVCYFCGRLVPLWQAIGRIIQEITALHRQREPYRGPGDLSK